MVRHNSNELVKVRLRHPSMWVAVEIEKPDASAILVRVPRRKSILSIPAVLSVPMNSLRENSR